MKCEDQTFDWIFLLLLKKSNFIFFIKNSTFLSDFFSALLKWISTQRPFSFLQGCYLGWEKKFLIISEVTLSNPNFRNPVHKKS